MKPNEAFEYLGFKRTTRFNKEGILAKYRKDWLSKDRHYRIYWRRQFRGVNVDPAFYAFKYVCVNTSDGPTFMWDFADERYRTYRTLGAAVKACMKAEKLDIQEEPKKKRKKRKKMINEQYQNTMQTEFELSYGKSEAPQSEAPQSEAPKRRGRPKGSKNAKPRADKGVKRGPRKVSDES